MTTTQYTVVGSVTNSDFSLIGPSSGTTYFPDGSFTTFTDDGNFLAGPAVDGQIYRNSTKTVYDVNGRKVIDSWTRVDGSTGTDTFNADGYSSGWVFLADSTSRSYTDNGQGHVVTTYYDANGGKTSDSWRKADGTTGADTFNADGTSSGTTILLNGNSYTYTNDGQGDLTYQYHFKVGNTIEISNSGGTANALKFGPGVKLSDIAVSATFGADGAPALSIDVGNGNTLIVDSGLDGAVKQFAFDNGASVTLDQLMAQATTIPVTISGANGVLVFDATGNTTLSSASDNDPIYAWGGGDTFVVNNAADIVVAHGTGNTVQSSVSYSLADNAPAVQDLTLTGTGDLVATGNDLDNVIIANDGNDTLIGGVGNDTLIGGGGLDTFGMSLGMGSDTVIDASPKGGIVQLGSGLSLSDLTASRQVNDLQLTIVGSPDKLNIKDYFVSLQAGWIIKDDSGSITSPQNVLDATAASPISLDMAQIESDFVSRTKADIAQGYQYNAYTLQADGSYRSPTVYSFVLYADSGSIDVQHNITYFNGDIEKYTSQASWAPGAFYQTAGSTISEVTQATQSVSSLSVIDATPSSTKDSYQTKWVSVYWIPAAYILSGDPQIVSVRDINGNVIGLDQQVVTRSGTDFAYAGILWNDSSVPHNDVPINLGVSYYFNSSSDPISYVDPLVKDGASSSAFALDFVTHNITDQIQQIYVGDGNHTVYGAHGGLYGTRTTIVNAGSGNNVINDAGLVYTGTGNDTVQGADVVYTGSGDNTVTDAGTVYAGSGDNLIVNASRAYGGTGNDTMIGGDTLVAGSGSDVLIGGNTMIAGSGNDQIFAGQGASTIQINPTTVGTSLLGGTGDSSAFLAAFYESMGVYDWQERYERAGSTLYYLHTEAGSGYFDDAQSALNQLHQWGWGDITIEEAIRRRYATATSIDPLPVLAVVHDGSIQPSSYYRNSDVPVVDLKANDFQTLATYASQGGLPSHNVVFGEGVSLSDLHLSWGETVGSISGSATDPKVKYVTLDVSWGTSGQSLHVMIPHRNDPLGSGVSQFTFADGTTISMADLVARAPAAPTFDPPRVLYGSSGANNFELSVGEGQTIIDDSAALLANGGDTISFGPGVTAQDVLVIQQGADVVVSYSAGDSVLIKDFDLYGVNSQDLIGSLKFEDGSSIAIQTGSTWDEEGSYGLIYYDANGRVTQDQWAYSDGTYGTDTFDPETGNGVASTRGSSAAGGQRLYGSWNAPTTFALNLDNGQSVLLDQAAQFHERSDTIQFGSGISAQDVSITQQGSDVLVTYSANDNILVKNFDLFGLDSGVLIGTLKFADGSSIGVDTGDSYDGPGTYSLTWYDPQGRMTRDLYADNSGGNALTTFNADGSFSGASDWSDGTRHTYTQDAQGNYVSTDYAADGFKAGDYWRRADGSSGSDQFNADGSSTGDSYNVDGSISSYTNDGHGEVDSETVRWQWQADAATESYVWRQQRISEQWVHADGSAVTNLYDPQTGELTSIQKTFALKLGDGQSVIDDPAVLLAASGDILNFGPGVTAQDVTFTQQGADVLVSYSANDSVLIKNFDLFGVDAPVLIGKATFPDGSVIEVDKGRNYDGPGTYSITWHDAHGRLIQEMWAENGGARGTSTYGADGSRRDSVTWADGTRHEYWQNADGLRGQDNFGTDGASHGWASHADGSYQEYANDGAGNVTTWFYDSEESLLSYVLVNDDGHGNVHTSNYDANDNLVSDSWVRPNAAPLANPLADQAAKQGEVFSFHIPDGSFTDPNAGDTLRFRATLADGSALPAWLRFDAATQTFSGTPGTTDVGSLALTVTATDAGGLSASASFDVTVASSAVVVSSGTGSGSGYTYGYQTLDLGNGSTESKVTYTYADDSTYSTDTVSEADGSYRQSWNKSDGSAGSTEYNAVTGEVRGSNATAGAGYSYEYDNTVLASGVSESRVIYTYTDGSTYSTDTVSETDGSCQQHWTKSDGSHGDTSYVAGTGEVSGDVAQAGAGYSYTYDNTRLSSGASKSKVTYTYADGSTYRTDTVSETDGSYQQSWAKSDGSTGSTDYNAVTGEVSGSNATAGAGYSYGYDNTRLAGGATESKVTYTYADGSTYATDTVSQTDGSYQQAWSKSDGSHGDTNYVASTGEVSGDVAQAGAGYSYTYDNTKLTGGATESKVTYTYTDGSTYRTDTVSETDGSYQQSWSKGDGSHGDTNYVAASGEVSGSVAQAGAGYSYTYDNAKLSGGASESKVTYTYTDGSTYSTDTISETDGSYQQSWSKSDGSSGTTDYVAATGEVSGSNATAGAGYSYTYENTVLASGVSESKVIYTYTDGSTYSTDTISLADGSYDQAWSKSDGTSGNSYVDVAGHMIVGSTANDTLVGGAGSDVLIGGAGSDTYELSRGDGADVIVENDANAGNTDTAQFDPSIASDNLWFRHVGNNLEVDVIGTSDSFTVSNWYLGSQYHVEQFKTSDGKTLLDSQVQSLVDAMASFTPPAAGQTTLPANYAAALEPVIAANWQ